MHHLHHNASPNYCCAGAQQKGSSLSRRPVITGMQRSQQITAPFFSGSMETVQRWYVGFFLCGRLVFLSAEIQLNRINVLDCYHPNKRIEDKERHVMWQIPSEHNVSNSLLSPWSQRVLWPYRRSDWCRALRNGCHGDAAPFMKPVPEWIPHVVWSAAGEGRASLRSDTSDTFSAVVFLSY